MFLKQMGRLLVVLLAVVSFQAAAERVVGPEVSTPVILSSVDVNRVVCDGGDVVDVLTSEEKGVTYKAVKKNLFIKFRLLQNGNNGETKPIETKTEMFITCGDTVFSLVISPRADIPTQTLYLRSDVDKATENVKAFRGRDNEDKRLKLIREAYRELETQDGYPESYEQEILSNPVGMLDSLNIVEVRNIRVPGVGLVLKEYEVQATRDIENIPLRMFMQPELSERIRAVSINRFNLKRGEKTQLFLVTGVDNVQ